MPIATQITNTPIEVVTYTYSISSVSKTSTTATYTASGHTFNAGDTIVVSGIVPDGYSGTFTINSVVAGTSFTCANTTNLTITTATGEVFAASATDFDYANVNQVRIADNIDVNSAFLDAQASAATALSAAYTAQSNAATALSNAAIAYNTAVNSLQPSTYAIQNPTTKQLTSIDTTGVTVYSGSSATSGARVVMNSVGIAGYNSSNTPTFSVTASDGSASFSGSITGSMITGSQLNIGGNFYVDGSTGLLQARDVTLLGNITATSATITGKIVASDTSTIAGWTISGTRIQANSGNSYLDSNSGAIATIGNITAGGNISTAIGSISSASSVTALTSLNGATLYTTSDATINGKLYNPGYATTTSAANAFINSSTGLLARSSSSLRYKVDVEPQIIPINSILALEPKSFFDKAQVDEKSSTDGLPRILGLIAEEVAQIPVLADLLMNKNEEGQPDSINYDRIAVALIPLLKNLNDRLSAFEGK